jgi:large subunit ribosomal protein L1
VKLFENDREFLRTVIKLKPQASKGKYVKSVFMSATMSPSIEIDPKSIDSAN